MPTVTVSPITEFVSGGATLNDQTEAAHSSHLAAILAKADAAQASETTKQSGEQPTTEQPAAEQETEANHAQSLDNTAETESETAADGGDGQNGSIPATQTEPNSQEPLTNPPPEKETFEDRHKARELARLERRIQLQKKEAEQTIQQAQQLQWAMSQPDPMTALQAIGVDPHTAYKQLTESILSDGKTKPVDPVQAKLSEHEAQLAAYAQYVNQQQEQLSKAKDQASVEHVKATQIAPILKQQEKYESLIGYYGGETAAQQAVFDAVFAEYKNSGQLFSFEQAADALETFYTNLLEQNIQTISQKKKFSKYFQKPAETKTAPAPTPKAKPAQKKTLTNSMMPTATDGMALSVSTQEGREARINALLAKYNK